MKGKTLIIVILIVGLLTFVGCGSEKSTEPELVAALSISLTSLTIDEPTTTGNFEVWNSGDPGSILTYSVTESCNWLSINITNGTSTGEHDNITVTVDFSSFDSGEIDTCVITISGADDTKTLSITATAEEELEASLSVSPTTLTIDEPTTTGNFEIWNSGDLGSTLYYTITENCDWLSINPTSGNSTGEHDNIIVTVDFSSFDSEETKTCIISISGANDTINVTVIANAEEDDYPPDPPSNPIPTNNSTNQSTRDTDLSWNCTDPDGDPLVFDVYFGSSYPLTQIANDISEFLISLDHLHNHTIYYWYVVAFDNNENSTQGDEWEFTTESSTTVTLYTSQDTFIHQQNPSSNYGNSTQLVCGGGLSLNNNTMYLTFVQFDFSSIPDDVIMYDGDWSISLYQYNVFGDVQAGQDDYALFRSDGGWYENILTWNNRPDRDDIDVVLEDLVDQDDIWVIFTTDGFFSEVIRRMLSGVYQNYGFQIWNDFDLETYAQLRSKDYGDPSKWPKMTITYQW